MGDEAHFYLNGHVNKQNMRFWSMESSQIAHASELHLCKDTVWCEVTSEKIIGPYFFQNPDENVITVTGEQFREMLESFVQPTIANMAGYWWQQDGGTAHTARVSMRMLTEMFQDKIISQNFDFPQTPKSPDLTPVDFFL